MQKYRSCRAVAAVTAVILILTGWLGAHHEAEVAHVHDAFGQLVHAQRLADHHEPGAAAHLHGRADHQHAPGACALIAAAPARTSTSPELPATTDAAIFAEAPPCRPAVPPSIAAYRLAPKTSPPART